MNGRIESFSKMYNRQLKFQEELTGKNLPFDDANEYQRAVTLLIEEVGELLKTDKRWKNLRNKVYCREEKLQEFADIFIVVLNLAIHSGFSEEEIVQTVLDKIQINFERLATENDNNS